MAVEISDILRQFSGDGLPREAIIAAGERRDEIVPVFTQEIEDFIEADLESTEKRSPIFMIFHLLGEWKEKSAYQPLARFLQCSPEKVDAAISDAITATSHRVMAAVFDRDPQPLYDIIMNADADEYIRSRMCETIAMLVLDGEIDREGAARFLRDCFMNLQPQAQSFVWNGWQSAIAMLGLSELKLLVKKAFNREFIDSHWLGFDIFEKDLKRGIKNPGARKHANDKQYTIFTDTIDELSEWYCFSDKYLEDKRRANENYDRDVIVGETQTNPFRGVGRNDPCPCGSGKKFKKCCLH